MNKLSALGGGLAAGLFLCANAVFADGGRDRAQIDGAWDVEVTLRVNAPDCANAAIVGVGPNPFRSLNTFHRGGTMSEFGTRSPPSTRTSGHGVWSRTGSHGFQYRYLFYSFDANGLLVATFDWRADLVLAPGGETFQGISRLVRTDLSGNELRFCATVSGERIEL